MVEGLVPYRSGSPLIHRGVFANRNSHIVLVPLTDWRRKPEFELETRQVIKHFDPRAVKTGNGSDQAEPQTVAVEPPGIANPLVAV